MASKHMTNGRRGLRDFEAHINRSTAAPKYANHLAPTIEVEPESFPELSHQQIGDRITTLKATWFLKDGSDRYVSSDRRAEQRSARVELAQLKIEFKKRLAYLK